jgi:hypothetical protein
MPPALELLALYLVIVAVLFIAWAVAYTVRELVARIRETDDPRIDASSLDWRRAREHRRRYEASERERGVR